MHHLTFTYGISLLKITPEVVLLHNIVKRNSYQACAATTVSAVVEAMGWAENLHTHCGDVSDDVE